MNLRIKMLLVAVVAISTVVSSAIFSACSKSQTEVNSFVTSIDNYTESIRQANNPDELLTLDQQFAMEIEKYVNSKATLDQADRNAIMESIINLAKVNNEKSAKLKGVPVIMSDSMLNARADEFRKALDKCNTLGEAVSMGL